MNQCWTWTVYTALLMIAGAAGCAKTEGLGTVKAGGEVIYKGQPVAGATVTFVPQSGKGAAVAMSDQSGRFHLMTSGTNGALPGSYKVTVTKSEEATAATSQTADLEARKKADMAGIKPASEAASLPKNLLPEKYATADKTPLAFEVQPSGQNNFRLELTD